MAFEYPETPVSEGVSESQDQVREDRIDLGAYLKTHKEIVLSKDDPEVSEELRHDLESRAGTAVSDGKTLDYIDREGNWTRVQIDVTKIRGGVTESNVRNALQGLGFRFVSVGTFYGPMTRSWESKKKRLAQESKEKKEGFDF